MIQITAMLLKKLVADPESCKDFYQVLQQVGLPYQTYYHKIPDKVAQSFSYRAIY
ncbi:hypothetical protein PT276_06630 [Orbaceae bacterium ESL0721]|nr:hypothetical protein [Orbaceae bacterium ESL0721]